MSSLIRLSALGLVTAVSLTRITSGAMQVTETFTANTDLYWEGVSNRTAPNNYGWSATDMTGTAVNPPGPDGIPGNADDGVATGAGEFGGMLSRGGPVPSFYGFDVGSIDPTEAFNVSGVIRSNAADGAFFLGYSTGADSFPDINGDLKNFIGVLVNDGKDVFGFLYTRNRNRTGAELPTLDLTIGAPTPFGLAYTPPSGGVGTSSLRVSVGNASATANFENGFAGITDPLTRFGIFPARNGTSTAEVYFDDVTFTSDNAIPEPASLGLLGLGGLLAMRRVRRA